MSRKYPVAQDVLLFSGFVACMFGIRDEEIGK